MGRPINKRYFGALGVDATPTIPVQAAGFESKVTIAEGGTADVFIVKQKSARRFLVQHTEDGSQYTCRLVNKATAGDDSTQIVAGEMVIVGYVNGQAVTIQSMTNKLAVDFNSNRYTWALADDSSSSTLVLTLVAPYIS